MAKTVSKMPRSIPGKKPTRTAEAGNLSHVATKLGADVFCEGEVGVEVVFVVDCEDDCEDDEVGVGVLELEELDDVTGAFD